MSLFKFGQNLRPIRIVDDKEKANKKLEAEKKANLEAMLDNSPSAFSVEEIVESELPNGSEEEKRALKEDLLNFITTKSEEKLKKEQERYIVKKPSNKEIKNQLEENKKIIFDEFKITFTKDFVEKIKTTYDIPGKGYAYFVAIAASEITKAYYVKLNIKATKKEFEKTKNKFKDYFYNKDKVKNLDTEDEIKENLDEKYKVDNTNNKDEKHYNPELRNFYEVEKDEG